MTFNFTVKEFIIGNGTPTLQFYKKGFNLGGIVWQDIILSGNTALTLTNAKADGLNYLKLFGGTEQRNLPSGYTQVEYLEVATEGAYFLTGINATVDTDMGITASDITSNSAQILVAQCISGGDYVRVAKASATQRLIGNFGSSSVTDNNTDGITKFTARVNKSGFYVNGSFVGTFSDIPSSFTGVGEVDIFRGKYSDTSYYAYAGSRFYSAWIDDNIFLPCRRNSDNQLGIYNTKTGQFILPSGEGTFTAGANVTTPTPDNPIDIVSNNGAIKVSKNLLDMNSVNIALGYYINNSGVISESLPNFYNSKYIPVKGGEVYTWSTSDSIKYLSVMEYDSSKTFIKRTLFGSSQTPADTSGTLTLDSTTAYVLIGSNMFAGPDAITLDSVLAVNWQFELGATATTYRPYGQIYTDGTVETVEITGKNLFDKTQQDTQYYYGNDGSNQELEREGSKLVHSSKIPCLPNTTYTLSGTRTAVTVTAYYKFTFWDKNGNFISYVNNDPVGLESYVRTATTPNDCYYIAFNSYNTDTNVMLEQGSTSTTYEPYFNGGSALAERLLKIGDYQDVQSVLDGSVTRNVGIKVLDGTEDWGKSVARPNAYVTNYPTLPNLSPVNPLVTTHFRGTTKSSDLNTEGYIYVGTAINLSMSTDIATTEVEFKQYLTDQYNAGTPVIIVYPINTPTTESVTAQPLSIQAGTNIAQITQGSIENLPLEVSYKGVV